MQFCAWPRSSLPRGIAKQAHERGAGWAVYKCAMDDPDFDPPVDDMEAQRTWLEGFRAVWAECPGGEAMGSSF